MPRMNVYKRGDDVDSTRDYNGNQWSRCIHSRVDCYSDMLGLLADVDAWRCVVVLSCRKL